MPGIIFFRPSLPAKRQGTSDIRVSISPGFSKNIQALRLWITSMSYDSKWPANGYACPMRTSAKWDGWLVFPMKGGSKRLSSVNLVSRPGSGVTSSSRTTAMTGDRPVRRRAGERNRCERLPTGGSVTKASHHRSHFVPDRSQSTDAIPPNCFYHRTRFMLSLIHI